MSRENLNSKEMKKIMTILGAILIALFIFTSCGGGSKDKVSVKPKTTAIKGDLGDYFEVVDKEYIIKVEDPESYSKEGKITVELKRNDKDFAFIFDSDKLGQYGEYGSAVHYLVGFGIELFTDEGPSLIRLATDYSYLPAGCISLMKLKKGETGYLSWNVEQTKFNGLKTFQLTSSFEEVKDSEASGNKASGNIVDCDKFIKDYEAFADSYIKLLKKYKANPTDATILTEYTDAAQKAAELQTDASNCTDTKYATKLLEIANKIAKAAM
jgi:hypothetical protein